MEISRLIKKAELFYKTALWSYIITKKANDDDDVTDKLINQLAEPSTFSSVFDDEIVDKILTDSLHEKFEKLLDDKNKIDEFAESGQLSKLPAILEALNDLTENLEEARSEVAKCDDDDLQETGDYTTKVYFAALDGLERYINKSLTPMFEKAFDEEPLNIYYIITALEEILHGESSGGFSGAPGAEKGIDEEIIKEFAPEEFEGKKKTVNLENMSEQEVKRRLEIGSSGELDAKRKTYRETYKNNIRLAREAGDPSTWDPKYIQHLQENAPWEVEKMLKRYRSLQKFDIAQEISIANRREKMQTDKEFAEKSRSEDAARQRASLKARDTEALKEFEAQLNQLRGEVHGLENERTNIENDLKSLIKDSPEKNKLKIEQLNKLIENKDKEIEKKEVDKFTLVDKINKIKALHKMHERAGIEETIQKSEQKGKLYLDPETKEWIPMSIVKQRGLAPKSLTDITDFSSITFEGEGWLEQLRQQINNERSAIKKKIIEKIKGDPELIKALVEEVEKNLQQTSDVEAIKVRKRPKPEILREREIDIQDAVANLRKYLAIKLNEYPAALEYGEMYSNTILLNKDFRIFVKFDLEDMASMGLDDPEKIPTPEEISFLEKGLESCEEFFERSQQIAHPEHKRWVDIFQNRILRIFMPRLRRTIDNLKQNLEQSLGSESEEDSNEI